MYGLVNSPWPRGYHEFAAMSRHIETIYRLSSPISVIKPLCNDILLPLCTGRHVTPVSLSLLSLYLIIPGGTVQKSS